MSRVLCASPAAARSHYLVSVSLDGAFGGSQSLRNLLVDLALNDKLENLMLARRQSFKLAA